MSMPWIRCPLVQDEQKSTAERRVYVYPVPTDDILAQVIDVKRAECFIKVQNAPTSYPQYSDAEVAVVKAEWDREIAAQVPEESAQEIERKKWRGRTKESLTDQDIRDLTYYLAQRAGLIT